MMVPNRRVGSILEQIGEQEGVPINLITASSGEEEETLMADESDASDDDLDKDDNDTVDPFVYKHETSIDFTDTRQVKRLAERQEGKKKKRRKMSFPITPTEDQNRESPSEDVPLSFHKGEGVARRGSRGDQGGVDLHKCAGLQFA